jgi:thiol-disulfide isomerase/thioredoxin
MTEDEAQRPRPRWRRLGVVLGLLAVALGIATVQWLSNGGPGSPAATDCVADREVHAAIDAAATGELAALQATAGGKAFDDLSFLDPHGNPTDLTAFRGRVLLVNFWASWCGPCRREMPALAALQSRYGGEDFAVVTVNLDTGDDASAKGRAFLVEVGTDDLPFYSDPSFRSFEVLRQRTVTVGLPTTLLLGPDGCEWGVMAGPAEWDSPDGHAVVETATRLAAR